MRGTSFALERFMDWRYRPLTPNQNPLYCRSFIDAGTLYARKRMYASAAVHFASGVRANRPDLLLVKGPDYERYRARHGEQFAADNGEFRERATTCTRRLPVLSSLGIRRDDVRGFAIGVAAHGIGTARAFQISEEAGAYAGLGMAMNGILTAFVLPIGFPSFIAWLSS